MPLFQYSGLNKDQKKIVDEIFAINIDQAKIALAQAEVTIFNIDEKKDVTHFWQKSYGGVSFKEKIVFLKYLSTIIKSGLSLKKALDMICVQIENKYFSKILNDVTESVEHGQSFHQSLAKHPGIFDEIFVNMVAVGEVAGTLPAVLVYLEKMISRDYQLKKKIQGAMIYPIILFVLIVTLSIGLVKFIVPKVAKIFTNFNVELPVMTKILISLNEFITNYGLLLMIFIVAVVVAYLFALKNHLFRKWRDSILLKLPIFGRLIKEIQITRFTQIFSSLIKSGVPVLKSLEISSSVLKNLVFRDYLAEGAKYLEKGCDLSEYLKKRPDLFSPVVIQMINLGESTGSIDDAMETLAELHSLEVKEKLKTITDLVAPLMLVIMGLLVGSIAISILMPIYQLPSLIKK